MYEQHDSALTTVQCVFVFTPTDESFRFKKTTFFLRGLVPTVPLMVSVVGFLALGAACGTLASRCPWFDGVWVAVLFVLSGVCVFLSSQVQRVKKQGVTARRVAWWLLLIGNSFAMCGWAWCCARLFPRNDFAWSLAESSQPVVVQGTVVATPEKMRSAQGFLGAGSFRETSVWVLNLTAARDLHHWVPVSGQARVFVDGETQPLSVGTHVQVHGRAVRPSAPNNPGEFDFRQHSQLNRVLTIIRVRGWSSIVVCPNGITVSAAGCIDWLRQRCRNRLHAIVPIQSQPLADSLLLGLRRALPEEMIRAFTDTGSIHILAISGLHVGLVATVVFYVFRFFGCPFRTNWLIVACVITIYAGLTGAALPVLRATLLLWVACTGVWMKRRVAGIHALAVVGALLLVWNPVSVMSIGTQLSFLATAVLISLGAWFRDQPTREPIERLIEKNRGVLTNAASRLSRSLCWGILLSASVWIASVPLVASEFHRFVPVAVGTNLLVGPLLPFVMAAGFACLITIGLPVELCEPLGVVAGFLFDTLTWLVAAIASIPASTLRVHALPTWWIVIWYLTLSLLLLHLCDHSKMMKESHGRRFGGVYGDRDWSSFRQKMCALGVFLFGFGVFGVGLQLMPQTLKESRVTIAAMGHGCGIVLKSREGHCLVYDAGRLGASGTALRSLRATLLSQRIHTIDYLVISHADTDHFNAVPGLLDEFCVDQVIVSPQFLASSSRSVTQLQALLVKHGVPVRTVLRGDVISIGKSCVARVLHPQRPPNMGVRSDNENSIVLDVAVESKRMLLTGDIEGDALRALLRSGLPQADILIAPHHGSKTGLPREITSEVRPDIVVVSGSGGRDWPFVCQNFHQGWAGLRAVLRTEGEQLSDRGAVSITMSDGTMSVRQFTPTGWRRVL